MVSWSRFVPAMFRSPPQTKAAVAAPINTIQHHPMAGMLSLNPQEITPYQAWLLYKTVAPFAKIVDLIADGVASLVPVVQINGKPVDGHPVASFLSRPGFNRTRRRLIKELAVQQLVCGTAYPLVYGSVEHGPTALDVLKAQYVTPVVGADMWPETYSYGEGTRAIVFARDFNPRDPRWIDTQGLSEIVPIYDIDGDRRGVGLSRLNAIRSDVDLRLKGIIHNTGLLDNGARLSGLIAFKSGLTPEQAEDVGAQMREMATGAQNAGRIIVTAGGEYQFENLMQSARDMDFAKLIEIVEDAIASRYNVPVSLFRTAAQTNNNYETAWNVLYDQSILPTFDVIYSALGNLFAQRLGQDISIVHDALTAPVLARQATARARDLFMAKLVTRNEARQMVGYEPVLGGDEILDAMGQIPVGEDMFTGIDEALGRSPGDAKPKPKRPEEKPARTPAGSARDDARSEKAFLTLKSFADNISRLQAGTVH